MHNRFTLFFCAVFLASVFFILPTLASASTSLGYQSLPGNTTWTPSASPYLINGWINIPTGSSLTLLPGTIVKLGDGAKLEVGGTLDAQGTAALPITITALTDDSVGGDSNGNGSATTAYPGSWGNIQIRPSAQVTLTNTHVRYGGRVWDSGYQYRGTILNNGGTLTITDAALSNGAGQQGILHNSGTTTVRGTTFSTLADAIHAETRVGTTHMGSLTISDNTFTSVSRALFLSNYLTPFSFNNEGGNQGGVITMNTVNLFGSTTLAGDLPYLIENWVNVPEGSALSILPGATFKGTSGSSFTVAGTLIAKGTSTAPITFTSSALTPHEGDWGGIIITSTGSTTLSHVNLSHGGASYWSGSTFYQFPQLRNDGGLLSLDHVTSASSSLAGLHLAGGTTTVTNSTFRNNQYGIFHTNGNLSLTDSAITNNGSYGIFNSGSIIDARNTWWGSATGPFHSTINPTGTGNRVSDHVAFVPWSGCDPTGNDTAHECSSNVLFLPGIKGSRLYRPNYAGGYDQLWEPTSDADAVDLRLSPDDGSSVREDIYVKKNDIIGAAFGIAPVFYGAFIDDMDALKTSGTIKDWEAVPYDWRLSVDKIINNGAEINGRIYYDGGLSATTSPYIIQELKRLAASSKTGKVTIIAHSNGGLVTKALIKKLQDAHDPILEKIDKVIFVAVPQSGTPHALGVLLHGYKEGLPGIFPEWVPGVPRFLTEHAARTLAENAPVAYNLLPSLKYFSDVADPRFPVVRFNSATLYQQEQAHYGNTIDTANEMNDFLLARDGGRVKPDETNLSVPNVLNPNLIALGTSTHSSLDEWIPPASLQLYQIAGWGNDTLAGIDYYDQLKTRCIAQGQSSCAQFGRVPTATYKPILTEDGDSVVVTPSAIAILESANVQRYWVNLLDSKKEHGDILKFDPLREFVGNIIQNKPESLPALITSIRPIAANVQKRLHYFLHSPLALSVTDSEGRISGYSSTTRQIELQIPGVSYGEFGEVKYVTVPADLPLKLHLDGYATGTFALDIEEVTGGVVTASTTFADVPTSPSTKVTMDMNGSIASSSPLHVDENGDGTNDFSLVPKVGEVVTLPAVPMDTTAPEALITFSTSTNAISITGIDESGTTTISSTTTYPTLKKNQKQYNGIATTTVTIKDMAGNTTLLVYAEKLPSPLKRDIITLVAISYNGATSSIPATLKYAWGTKNDGTYKKFVSVFATSSVVIESHFRPKKNITVIMNKPIDMDDSDNDAEEGDDVDTRPIKTKLIGFVVPSIVTKQGKINVTY